LRFYPRWTKLVHWRASDMKKWICWIVVLVVAGCALWIQRSKSASAKSVEADETLGDQLLTVEQQFWESWKNGEPQVFQELMTGDAVFFGQYGVASKSEILRQQKESVEACKVESYRLTNPRAVNIDDNAAILLYEAEQHATCGGAKVQPFMHGSSVYVKRAGKWLNLYRSEVPPAR
jgi:hypothetical protein